MLISECDFRWDSCSKNVCVCVHQRRPIQRMKLPTLAFTKVYMASCKLIMDSQILYHKWHKKRHPNTDLGGPRALCSFMFHINKQWKSHLLVHRYIILLTPMLSLVWTSGFDFLLKTGVCTDGYPIDDGISDAQGSCILFIVEYFLTERWYAVFLIVLCASELRLRSEWTTLGRQLLATRRLLIAWMLEDHLSSS